VVTRVSGRPPAEVARVQSPFEPSFDLAESKLRPPVARRGIVARTALVDQLVAASGSSVISVIGPAGYGKTTLLAQWAERNRPRVGWVSVDDRDNDPVVLLTYIAVALNRIEPIDPRVFRALASSGAAIEVPRRLVSAMARMRHPVALVIDHFEALTNPQCLDAVVMLALGLPVGSQLAIGSRDVLPLPTARVRAQGGIVEIGIDDLAIDLHQAGSLLHESGVELAGADLDELVRRTEGWPVGLYLAALAVNAGGSPTVAGVALTGDDRYIGDYLRSEILDRVSPEEVSFLTRTSILDRMCGPLCDAVVGVTGSAALLERLERRNLLVVPLDRHRRWYRYHQLFRDLLVSELRRGDPGLVPELHRRAEAWCEANGMPENALDHAQAAGDADTAARLLVQLCNPVWASGRNDTVRRWMDWFEANDLIERHPGVAVCGALQFAVDGRPAATERWADAAEAISMTGVLTDGSTIEGMLAYLRANLCRTGPEAMRRDAQVAWLGLSATSPFRCNMIQVEGLSHLLDGDTDRADAFFARAVDEADRLRMRPFAALVLADRGSVALERDDWAAAGMFADQALTIVHGGEFDDYWTSAFVYAWAARVAVHRGDPKQGKQLVARAARLRRLLTYALPVVSARALLEMARVYIALADPGGARAVLRQVNDIFQQRPALGNLPQQAEELRAKVETIRDKVLGASSLTTAELRLLPLLPTHLSFREIGERLYVSRHTVKTQAISVYRKLGVSSRSETIDRMHKLGLLERI
jgi:LuxR family transcriptional regulator, maltose regulon positive regulatory protein